MSALFGSVAAKLARCMPRMMLDVALKIIIRRRVSPRPPSRILSLKQVVVFGDGAPSGMYRIPSLLRLPDGTLFALCEERLERADSGSVRVVARSSSDGGSTWSALRIVASGAEIGLEMAGATVGNPCCVYDAVRDRIVLLVTVNDGSAHESAIWRGHARRRRVFVLFSSDGGLEWSSPSEITSAVSEDDWTWYATGPGRAVQTEGGRLVFPCNHVRTFGGLLGSRFELRSHTVLSDDGEHFRKGGASPAAETNESTVASVGGRLILNMRQVSGHGLRRLAASADGGESWQDEGHAEQLSDPLPAGCHACLLAVPGGVLYSGPAGKASALGLGGSVARFWREELYSLLRKKLSGRGHAKGSSAFWEGRHTLQLRFSPDGLDWAAPPLTIHAGPAAYSCAEALGGAASGVGVLFEAGESRPDETIRFCRVPPSWPCAEN